MERPVHRALGLGLGLEDVRSNAALLEFLTELGPRELERRVTPWK
jgi:hypothetical protein